MQNISETLIYLSVGLVIGVFVILLLFLGPFGWIMAGFLLVSVYLLLKWSGLLKGREQSILEKMNCTACGARNPIERDDCSYCGEPLEKTFSE